MRLLRRRFPKGRTSGFPHAQQPLNIDDHPLYVMRYEGAYISGDEDVERDASSAAARRDGPVRCSPRGDAETMVYGRNLDWEHSPAVLLFTAPPDGYASVSLVDIAFLEFTAAEARDLTQLSLEERQPLLDAPHLPFDGMNEYGLAIGMAAIHDSPMPYDPAKRTIGSLGIIREMLDHARTVDEAIAVMESYNVDMSGGPAIHYLTADASDVSQPGTQWSVVYGISTGEVSIALGRDYNKVYDFHLQHAEMASE